MTKTVTISREAAEIINRWFLPLNANKLRRPNDPEGRQKAIDACVEFKAALAKSEEGR